MRKAGDTLKLRHNMRQAKAILSKPRTVSEIAIRLHLTYNQANHLIGKMLKSGAVARVGNRYKLRDEEIIPMPVFIERQLQDERITITRAQAKEIIMDEMLDVYQPLSAIALRCGLAFNSAKSILDELEKELKVKSSTFRLDGHNRSISYKKASYIKAMGVFMPIQEAQEFVL